MVQFKKKFMDGRMSPEDVHQRLAFKPGSRCLYCSKPPMTRATVLAPLDEVKKRDPSIQDLSLARPDLFLAMLVQTKHGPHVRISEVYSCKECTPALEKAVAKHPSWCIVDFDRGPGADRIVVQRA